MKKRQKKVVSYEIYRCFDDGSWTSWDGPDDTKKGAQKRLRAIYNDAPDFCVVRITQERL